MNYVPFYETAACIISLIALIYGIAGVIKYDMPMYFRLPVAAVGCYALEELWVLVNTIFGHYGSFISVRLFGIFGFFSFLLCANTGTVDKILDESGEENRIARITALIAPALLLILYSALLILKFRNEGIFTILLGYVVFLPIFPSSSCHRIENGDARYDSDWSSMISEGNTSVIIICAAVVVVAAAAAVFIVSKKKKCKAGSDN